MIIKDKINDVMNKQINRELFSSYLYLSMAAFFESHNLSGFAKWMRMQAQEEEAHAMRFYDYILERSGKITMLAIEAPKIDWKSPLNVFEEAYEHEKKVTEMINNIMEIAKSEKDYASEEFLNWFVKEQVEEEANTGKIADKLKKAGDHLGAIYMIDHELGKRGKE